MDFVRVTADLADVMQRLPTEKLAKTVMARAVNRAMVAGRTEAAREVVKNYAVRQRQVTEKTKIQKMTATDTEAVLTFAGPALNVADFKVAPPKPQPAKRPTLRVTIGKQHGQKPYKGAFLVNVRTGTAKAFRRSTKNRLPIVPVYGPSIPNLIGSDAIREAVQTRIVEVTEARLNHEINRELLK